MSLRVAFPSFLAHMPTLLGHQTCHTSGRGQHGHSAMRQFRLTKLLHCLGRGVLGESERVKESKRLAVANHAVDFSVNCLMGCAFWSNTSQGSPLVDKRRPH